ncbi:phosphoglycolate phosphatase [Roseovarius salinarum]|uniref:phosphoglycolate phosphatase n=1 Tax=Roseovarius salinarum TaxID=1981892 RepID=UPI000C335E93|nr:phosphoglycolate phosphatase [Roseovarius salinarum]
MKAAVFDLDGTLIDSAPDIHAAVNRMLAEEGLPRLDLATVTGFIGNGLPRLVERVIDRLGVAPDQHARLTQRTLVLYNAQPSALSRPFPNLAGALDALRAQGWALGVCTNKPLAPARDILRDFGLDGHFAAVVGGDCLAVKKPDPAPLTLAFERLGAARGLFVGDSEIDAETAARAGVPFALFTEGYRKRPVAELPHSFAFSDFAELAALAGGALDRAG